MSSKIADKDKIFVENRPLSIFPKKIRYFRTRFINTLKFIRYGNSYFSN